MTDADPWAGFQKDEGDPVEREWITTRAASGEPETLTDPLTTVFAFLKALQHLDDPEAQEELDLVVTPESRDSWDFTLSAATLGSFGQWGVGSQPKRAMDARDVAFAGLLPEVGNGFRSTADQIVPVLATITLVWRPERGYWMVHQLGQPVHPDQVPRTSPGVAP